MTDLNGVVSPKKQGAVSTGSQRTDDASGTEIPERELLEMRLNRVRRELGTWLDLSGTCHAVTDSTPQSRTPFLRMLLS